MASGIIYGSTSNQYIDSKIEWSSVPLNTSNKSEVTASLWYRRNNSWTGTPTSGTGTFGINIDGQSGSTTISLTIPNGGAWVKALEIKRTVDHNSDGKRSIIISASGSISVASLASTACSGTAVLDNISRQAILTSAPDFTDESNPTIHYTNPAGDNVTSLQACIAIGWEVLIPYREIAKTGTSYTFNFTEDERKLLWQACTGKTQEVVFFVTTDIGGEKFFSYTPKTLSVVNADPVFTENQISYADTNKTAIAVTGNNQHIVQNQSNLQITIGNATAKKEASISKYELTVNGVTKEVTASGVVNFGKVASSSNVVVNVKVTDSRGNTTTASKTITMLAWSPPSFTASLERLNNYEDTTNLTVDALISSINNKNNIEIKYRYKEFGGEYGSYDTIENNVIYTVTCDKNKIYIFEFVVKDSFAEVTKELSLSKGTLPLFIDTEKNAVGINDFPLEGESLRVSGGIANFISGVKMLGHLIGDFVIECGEKGIWTYEKWASGKAVCWGVTATETFNIDCPYGTTYYSEPTNNGKTGYAKFPDNLFCEAPTKVHVQNYSTAGLIGCHIRDVSKDEMNFFVSNPILSSISLQFTIEAIGRWKLYE